MPARVGAEIAVVIIITAVLVIAGFGLLELSDGAAAGALLSGAVSTAVGFVGIGFAVSTLATIVGGILVRARPRRIRLLVSILAGLVGAVVNIAVGAAIGLTAGGWAALLLVFAVIGAGILIVAVVVAALLTYLVAFRRSA